MIKSNRTYLFGKNLDFLLLGGGSIIALIIIRLIFQTNNNNVAYSLELTIFLSNIINNPHFAASYLIFYENFWEKITSKNYDFSLRVRYFLFGIFAPLALIYSMAYFVLTNDVVSLGIFSNIMFLLVGWHYVKQGYGMAMLDASMKKLFFSDNEKKALLSNAYAVWILSWCLINFLAKNKDVSYFGVPYVAFDIPYALMVFVAAVAGLTTINFFLLISRRIISKKKFAFNGVFAYGVSLYVWLLIRDPIVILWVPLFHSLQYLTVVWRFKANKFTSLATNLIDWKYKMAAFYTVSFALGYYFFFYLPGWLDHNIKYDKSIFGGFLFFFLFWVFVNIHHYLLDTVMWRKNNPDVKNNLF